MTPRNSLERKILERARNIGPGEEANIYAEAEEFGVRLDEVDSVVDSVCNAGYVRPGLLGGTGERYIGPLTDAGKRRLGALGG